MAIADWFKLTAIGLGLLPTVAILPAAAQPDVTPPALPETRPNLFFDDNGKPAGPITLAQIRVRIAAGAIKAETLVWKPGLPSWVAAKALPEVAELFAVKAGSALPATPKGTPSNALETADAIMEYLQGSWLNDADGGITYTFESNGRFATKGGNVVVNGVQVLLRGTYSVKQTGAETFQIQHSEKQSSPGGGSVAQSSSLTLTVVDHDTMRGADGRVFKRNRGAKEAEKTPVVTPNREQPEACTGEPVSMALGIPAFRSISPITKTDDRQLVMSPRAQRSANFNYLPAYPLDKEVCVTIKSPPKIADPDKAIAGLTFWGVDTDHTLVFEFSVDGSAALVRKDGRRFDPLVAFKAAPSLNTAPGDTNVLRVTTRGSTISLTINDKPFATLAAPPPAEATHIGLFAQSEDVDANVWTFSDLRVAKAP